MGKRHQRMKEIQGKIKFLVIPIPKDASHERIYMEGTVFVDTPEKRAIICGNVSEFGDCVTLCKLSEITEEQASEFVGDVVNCGDEDIFTLRMYYNSRQKLRFILRENGFNTRGDGDLLLIKLQ